MQTTAEPLLCVTVAAPTMEGLRADRTAAEKAGAEIVELRLDKVDRPDVAGALDGRRLPVIVTCRAQWEGGGFAGSEEERRRVLETALAAGAEFVDVEAAAAFAPEMIRQAHGRRIVVSRHLFDGPPADLGESYRQLRSMGAEVSKLAFACASLSDWLPLLRLTSTDTGSHVLLGMGPAGVPSRLLAARLGNRWTYAGDGVAPGQLPVARVLNEFGFHRIGRDTPCYGVVGHPVGHSRSPVMHNAGFAAVGLDAIYLPLEASSAADFVQCARELPLSGASITAPFKVSLLPFMDDVDPVALRVGAVNTLVVRDGRWVGANTDVDGFLAPLAGRVTLPGVRATILGGGGATRAAAVALADQGAAVTISARDAQAAGVIADLVSGQVGAFPPAPGTWDLLVNATPAGTGPQGISPMAGVALDGQLVYDMVYEPACTALLADARAAGCDTLGGLEMLVAQAERQFELWTGQRPPAGLFANAAARTL